MKDIKKIIGAGVAGALLLSAGAFGGAHVFPEIKEVPRELTADELAELTPEPTVNEVEVPVKVEVEKIVEVDNGKLALVLDHIYDNEGKIEYLLEYLDDDRIAEIADRIVFVNDIKAIAEQKVKEKFADEIDNRVFNEVEEFDEDDISKIKINSNDVKIKDIDFEDGDAIVSMLVKFEGDDDVEYEADVEVEFDDGDFDDIKIVAVRLRD